MHAGLLLRCMRVFSFAAQSFLAHSLTVVFYRHRRPRTQTGCGLVTRSARAVKSGRGVRESQLRRTMLSARSNASNDKPDTKLPAFLLETTNLDNYRPWMKRVREWARRQGGTIMENHLIGEVVPAQDLTPETIAAADMNVVGYSAPDRR